MVLFAQLDRFHLSNDVYSAIRIKAALIELVSMFLEKTKHELLYTDDKILNIAAHTDYSCLQKLSANFKEYTGISPSELRKSLKKSIV